MHTAADETASVVRRGFALWAATDPVEPVHDYNIPILPFKHPPTPDDFQKIRRRRKQQEIEHDQPEPDTTDGEGHVDDYA